MKPYYMKYRYNSVSDVQTKMPNVIVELKKKTNSLIIQYYCCMT